MERLYTIYRTHHIKGMMSPSYYIYFIFIFLNYNYIDIIPRSVLMVEMGSIYYLLCALGDGCLYYYTLDPHTGI